MNAPVTATADRVPGAAERVSTPAEAPPTADEVSRVRPLFELWADMGHEPAADSPLRPIWDHVMAGGAR